MSVKRVIPLLLLLLLLLSACQSRESALFRENFTDAPPMGVADPAAVAPTLDEAHMPEIIAACKQSGINSPRFLSDDAPPADGELLQISAYHLFESGKEVRCTYFLYIGKNEVYSRWIEVSEIGSNSVSIFPANTPEEELIKEFL